MQQFQKTMLEMLIWFMSTLIVLHYITQCHSNITADKVFGKEIYHHFDSFSEFIKILLEFALIYIRVIFCDETNRKVCIFLFLLPKFLSFWKAFCFFALFKNTIKWKGVELNTFNILNSKRNCLSELMKANFSFHCMQIQIDP